MSIERRVAVLEKSALFQDSPTNALAELAARGSERKLRHGQILFTANDPANGLYIVLSGSVRAFRENIDGREQTIHVERAGGLLAEVAVFDGGPYPSSTVAEEDSEVLFLAKEDVRRFMLQHPETALTALALMAKRLRNVASLAEQLALKDVSQRLGTVREVVTRGLQKLAAQGTIEMRGHRIVVLNVKALRAQTDAHPKSSPTGADRQ
jgi:CRP-like cAMP-binding protein